MYKKSINLVLLIAFVAFLASCTKDETVSYNENQLLLGNWSFVKSEEGLETYQRTQTLKSESYGVTFKENNTFIMRTAGWCGTPPLSYSDIEGSYQTQDTSIDVKMEYYPGNFGWEIVSLDSIKLVVSKKQDEQTTEYDKLTTLYKEIEKLATNVSCTDATAWSFTPIGSKACGGPQSFIAYPNSIDTVAFLKKVDAYTKAEDQYNIKWNIISTCEAVATPKKVICVDGKATLVY